MSNIDKQKRALHFSTTSYPRFGRGVYSEEKPPRDVKNSPFYWWFKFLQLNDVYKQTAANKGIGKCADLYKDFGDVWKYDFKKWWNDHAHLFADEESQYKLRVANNQSELAPFGVKEAINVVVPLTWSQKSLKKHFALLIKKHGVEIGKRGPLLSNPKAKYSLGRRWNCGAMESAYKVYVIRQSNMERGSKDSNKSQHKGSVSNKFKYAWADVAIAAKLSTADGMVEGKVKADDIVQRRLLTILAIRHYKKAESFISAAATSSFPLSL